MELFSYQHQAAFRSRDFAQTNLGGVFDLLSGLYLAPGNCPELLRAVEKAACPDVWGLGGGHP